KKIAVLKGSAAESVLKEKGWTDDQIIGLDDSLKPFEVLKAKRVEAVLCESIIANYYAAEDGKLARIAETFAPGEYGAAVRKSDPELLLEINRHLADMKKSGELGELYQRWDLWTPQQEELDIVKGEPQEIIPLAHRIYLRWEVALQIGLQLLIG